MTDPNTSTDQIEANEQARSNDRHDLVVSNGTVVTPEQGSFHADVGASDGVISQIAAPGSLVGDRRIDATGKHVLPGAIDPHTHYGLYRDYAKDHETETRGNLVGGVTTIGNIFRRPGPYTEFMDDYVAVSEAESYHDYFYTLGLLSHDHVAEIPEIIDRFGITTFKWYVLYKYAVREKFGLDEDLTDAVGNEMIRNLAGQDVPTTLGYHSENVEITNHLDRTARQEGRDGYAGYASRFPGYAEAQSMVAGANLASHHGYDDRFYAVHISSKRTVEDLRTLQSTGYGTMGETCPHYLMFTQEECDDRMKVTPPIRGPADRQSLWRALADGTIDHVGTDHVCNRLDDKVGDDIWESLLAFPGSSTMLPLILSEGVHEGRISLERAVEVTSTNTAKAWNLYPKKGTIRVGADADLAVVDLNETKTVTPELLKGGADYSIYEGMAVTGWPTQTIVRGSVVYDDGEITGEKGYGTHVDRPVSNAI